MQVKDAAAVAGYTPCQAEEGAYWVWRAAVVRGALRY
jgi:hypothetical protein